MLESVDDDETILYKSPKITNKKVQTVIYTLAVLGCNTFIFLIMFFAVFSEVGLIGFLVIIGIFNAIMVPFLYFVIVRPEKETWFFLLSNKKLWVYKKGDITNTRKVHINGYAIKSLKGIIFRKRFFDKNKSSGTVEFLTDNIIPMKITIKNVPQMNIVQNLIESIFFHYGAIQEKWNLFKKEDIDFPQSYQISDVELARVKKSVLISGIILLSILPVCYLISYLISFFVDQIVTPIIMYTFGLILAIILLTAIIVTIRRTSKKGSELSFNEGDFSLKSKRTTKIIPFNKTVAFNIRKSRGALNGDNPPRGILENYDYIKIGDSYKTSKSIRFGPFTKLPYIIDYIFIHIINWKFEQGYLLSKEDLITAERN